MTMIETVIEYCKEHFEDSMKQEIRKQYGHYYAKCQNKVIIVSMFGNYIGLFTPDGGKLFSNCGYNTITTKKALNNIGGDWHKAKNVDLYPIYKQLIENYGNC